MLKRVGIQVGITEVCPTNWAVRQQSLRNVIRRFPCVFGVQLIPLYHLPVAKWSTPWWLCGAVCWAKFGELGTHFPDSKRAKMDHPQSAYMRFVPFENKLRSRGTRVGQFSGVKMALLGYSQVPNFAQQTGCQGYSRRVEF